VNSRQKKSAIEPARLYHERSRFSQKLMVSCCVSWNGKTKLFILNNQGVKVDADRYVQHLSELLPECETLYPDGDYIFVQDGVPSHRAKVTHEYLTQVV
jgi:hypothetical protein